MSYQPIFDTEILSTQLFTAESGRKFQLFTLACPDFTYQPGQFIMVQEQGNSFYWSYPYMIYHSTPEGPQVIAAASSSLFGHQAGDKISFWGANGKGCPPGEKGLFIAEPATLPLILPLIRSCTNPDVIIAGKKEEVPLDLLPLPIKFFSEANHIRENIILYQKENSQLNKESALSPIYMALNIAVLEAIMQDISPDLAEQVFLFASTRIGCGIGACKACYLHSPDIHVGIPVCCNGPYLPYTAIDMEKDRKCFQQFF